MRYRIEGESKATGQRVTVIVEADSTVGARNQAVDMGIDIVTLNVANDEVEIDPGQPLPIRPAVSQKPMWAIVFLIVLVAFIGLIGLGAVFFVAGSNATMAVPAPVVAPAPVTSQGPDTVTEPAPVEPEPATGTGESSP